MISVSRLFGARAGNAGSRIYLDLTDIVSAAIWHQVFAGIPRVQLEIAVALVRARRNVVPFSLYAGIWGDLRPLIEQEGDDAGRLLQSLQAFHPYPGARVALRQPLQTAKLAKVRLAALGARLTSRTPRFSAADTLFVGGAFWMSRVVMNLCAKAAAKGANLIVLIHDLIPITDPQFTGNDFAKEYREMLRLQAHFIVTTPFSREALEHARKSMGVSTPAIASIVPLADEFPGAARNESASSVPEGLERLAARPFALCVGTVEVRKNHLALLSVWDELGAELGEKLPTLVVAGRRGWKAEAALQRLDAAGRDSILFVEAPSDAALRWLYSACLFTIFPSLFEGWGLPVGESLWFGKPCAASNASAIPFAGRDLCLYFSPQRPDEIKAAVRRLLDPAVRRDWAAKIAAARLRTWAEVAEDVARLIGRPGAQ